MRSVLVPSARRRHRRGVSALEAVIAAGLIAMIGLAVTASVITSGRTSRRAAEITNAARLGQEAAERARAFGCGVLVAPMPLLPGPGAVQDCDRSANGIVATATLASLDDPSRLCSGESLRSDRVARRVVSARRASDSTERFAATAATAMDHPAVWADQNPGRPSCLTVTGLASRAGQVVTLYLTEPDLAIASRRVDASGTVVFVAGRYFTDTGSQIQAYQVRAADGVTVLRNCSVLTDGATQCPA